MTMHAHDLDLIMALAEGTLDVSDVPSAEAAIAACPECSEDLELQRLAIGALEAAPPVAMTEMESAQMRRTLRHELGLVPAAKPAKPQRRWFPIGALASAAALLLALVVVGPGLDLLGPGSDDSGTEDVVAFSETATTAAAERAGDASDGQAPTPAAAEAPRDDVNTEREEAGETATTGGSTTTTRGATTTTSASEDSTTAPEAPATAMRFAAEPDLTALRDVIISLGITADTDLSQFEAELRARGLDFELTTTAPAAYTQECLAFGVDAIASATSGYALGQAPVGDTEVMVAVYETGTPGNIVVAVQDTTTCQLLDTSG